MALPFVSASDDMDNGTIAIQESLNTIKIDNDEILSDSSGTFAQLNDKIQKTSSGGTIVLDRNYTYGNGDENGGITIHKDITIDGAGHTLDGAGQSAIFRINGCNQITLKNINFVNAKSGNGGALSAIDCNHLDIINSNFTNNTATVNGGAIYSSGTMLTVSSSTFTQNTASYGGAIYLYSDDISPIDNTIGIIDKSSFVSNEAGFDGGALWCNCELSTVTNSRFVGDRAKNGAGMYLSVGVDIDRCTFINEHADHSGGAVYAGASNFDTDEIPQNSIYPHGWRNSIITNCTASLDGGGGYIEGDHAEVDNVTFIGNRAIHDGGALMWAGDYGIINKVTCIANNAAGGSGSICLSGFDVSVYDSVFRLSNATVSGGAIYVYGDNASITNSLFDKCAAVAQHGGAIYVSGLNTIINQCNFTMNRVNFGVGQGASINVQGDNAKITQCDFDRCSAFEGGFVYISGNDVTIDECTGIHSYAVNGGSFYIKGNNVTVSNSNISLNNASHLGGAVYVAGDFAKLDNNRISKAIVYSGDGGAIYVEGANTTISRSSFVQNRAQGESHGGSINVQGNGTKILNCTFDMCNAYDGGVLYVKGSNALVDGYVCIHSLAYNNGGAIYVAGDYATITDFDISMTNATNCGGAVYVSGNFANIRNSNLTRCIAYNHDGGALYVSGLNTTLSNSKFIQNRVNTENGRGGSIDIEGNYTKILNCTFDMCTAYDGGVVYIDGSHALIDGYSCIRSLAANDGGAIYIKGDNATIADFDMSLTNATNYGGAIYVEGNFANIRNSNFTKCISYNKDGGALCVVGLYTTITNSCFTQNRVNANNGRGGSINIQGNYTRILNSTFVMCNAYEGGVIYVNGSYVLISGYSCTMSYATNNGGAIYVAGDYVNVSSFDVSLSNATNYGGALYVSGNNVNIESSNFTRCIGDDCHGGALYIAGLNATVSKSKFVQNRVNTENGRGGSIEIQGNGTKILNCSFDMCTAYEGAIMYINGSDTTVEGFSSIHSFATNNGGAFYIAGDNTLIKDFTISMSNATNEGGAIYIAGDEVDILNGNISICIASKGDGGAIYVAGYNTTVKNCDFDKTQAFNGNGGAIFLEGNLASVEDSTFIRSFANNGGVIYISGHDAAILNNNLMYSWCVDSGGAIYIEGHDVSIINSSFAYTNASSRNNPYAGFGGAIFVYGDNVNITSSTFFMTVAEKGGSGGAVYILGEYVNIDKSNFTNTTAPDYFNLDGGASSAGAIAIEGNHANVTNSNFLNCHARNGGVMFVAGSNTYLINSTILDSNATYDGGALYIFGDHTYVLNTTFENVETTRLGGAIFIRFGEYTTFESSKFINCTSTQGGAIDIEGRDVQILYTDFLNCTAVTDGGAIFVDGDNVLIFESNFIECDAYNGNGGSIYWIGSYGEVDNSNFINNSAQKLGGAICLRENTGVKFQNSHFINNTAGINGGAIDFNRGASNGAIINSTFENNVANRSAGAVFWFGTNGVIKNSNFTNNKALGIVNYTDSYGNVTYGGYGGAVMWTGALGNVDNCIFEDNYAQYNEATKSGGRGGAVYLQGSDVGHCIDTSFTNSVFINNTAGFNGGAVDWYHGAINGLVANSTFIDNTAGRSGGAVYWSGINGTVKNSTFINNSALGEITDANGGGDGGAVLWVGHEGSLNDVKFLNNVAAYSGGAIFLKGSDDGSDEHCDNVSIYDALFENNFAGLNGGAVDFQEGAINGKLSNATFINNAALRNGGAIFWYGHNGTVTHSIFIENEALGLVDEDARGVHKYIDENGNKVLGGSGGAISWIGDIGSVDDSEFIDNTAARLGGAIYLRDNAFTTFKNDKFINNTAGINGGAIDFNRGAHDGAIINSTFENNVANRSAGAVFWFGTNGTIKDSLFINNSALGIVNYTDSYGNITSGGYGGAVMWTGSKGVVVNSIFTDNEAAKRGGAVYLQGSDVGNCTNTTFDDCLFARNVAGTNGGAVDWHEGASDGRIFNSIFEDNAAGANGGAVYWRGHDGVIFDSVFSNNTARGLRPGSYGNVGDGGAMFWAGINGTVVKCVFTDNVAVKNPDYDVGGRGGAVYIEPCNHGNYNTTFRDVLFEDNVAGTNGGAIDWHAGAHDGLVVNATFINNTAKRSGGAIYWSGINGTIKNSKFTENRALGNVTDKNGGGDGGAVLWVGQNGIIKGSKFKDNRAAYSGGAVFLKGSDDGSEGHCNNVTIDNGLFENNFAGLNGGAVDFQEGAVNGRLSNSNLINNTALRNGGAVFWYGHNGTVKSCNFTDNKALGLVDEDARGVHKYIDTDGNKVLGGSGGAVSWIGDIGYVIDCNFVKNDAEKQGGAIFLRDNLFTTFKGDNFTNNSAKQGGAIYWKSQSNEILTDCILTGNVASKGSAIYLAKNNLEIIDSVLLNNKADSQDLVLNVTKTNNNQTIDVIVTLRGNDNLLNAIWNDGTIGLTNVTYWGIDGVTNTGSERRVPVVLAEDVKPGDYDNIYQTRYEDYQDITFYIYDRQNNLLTGKTVKTNISGMARFKYASSSDKLYELVFHPDDNYYTGIENSTSKKLAYAIIPATDIYYLENESFVISIVDRQNETVPSGNVTVLLNGAEIGNFTLEDGKTPQIVLTSLPCGTYNVTVKYTGSEDFFPAINSTTFKVMKIASFIIPTIENYTYGEKGKMIIKVPENETNTISINLNGKTYEVKVNESGCAEFEIPELDFGVYEVELDYPETNNYFKSANRTSFEICPGVDLNIVKSANAREVYVDEEITYTIVVYNAGLGNATEVKVSEKLSKSLKFISADTEYGYYSESEGVWHVGNLNSSTSATLTLTVKAISAGEVKNTVSVGALEKDLNSSDNNFTCENVTVIQRDSPIEIDVKDITYGEAIVITVKAPKDSNGTVNVTVCGETYNDLPVYDGQIVFEYDSLAGGDYDVDVTFSGDNKYKPNSTHASFNVAKLTPEIKIEVVDIKEGEIEVLNVTVNAPGTVLITVDGLTIEIPLEDGVKTTDVLALGNTLNYDGKATWNLINLPLGAHNAFAVYKGNENYTSVNTSAVFHVRADVGDVSVILSDINEGDDEIINIKYPEDATGDVTIMINGKSYTKSLRNGEVSFTIPKLKAGKYKFDIYYSGDDKYLPAEAEGSFKVSKVSKEKIKLTDDNIDFDGKKFTVTLPSDATGTVTIEIDGKVYTKSVKDGKAVFELSGLKHGDYSIFVAYSGDDKYDEVSESFMINVDFDKGSGATHEGKSYGKLSSERVNLSDYATGNPVWIILLICALIGLIRPRRYRK
ncbi:Ig-like domain repeat protein [uncultured Methanobrevibacter sp.]|uniref:Ig-like domain repeat protein n=1 Tax=uncultured Methanobrevibacter sp. TaxID=253161 RepID=UPI0025CF9FAD|nr:Ig-like domain repeat protein [uncultured Methanobrevibacter sp.]